MLGVVASRKGRGERRRFLRGGNRRLRRRIGETRRDEANAFRYMVERNAINFGYREFEFRYLANPDELDGMEL